MRSRSRRVTRAGGALLASVLTLSFAMPGLARGSGVRAAEDTPSKAECSFSNPAFSGLCREIVDVPKDSTPKEACEVILGCLNNVNCLKTYCQSSSIRSGWKLTDAKPL